MKHSALFKSRRRKARGETSVAMLLLNFILYFLVLITGFGFLLTAAFCHEFLKLIMQFFLIEFA